MWRRFIVFLGLVLPWPLKRLLWGRLLGYRLHRHAHIGLAWVEVRELEMAEGAAIGHLTVIRGLDRLVLGRRALLGRLNWITAFPRGDSRHFAHQPDRRPELILGAESAVTNRHLIDCTARVEVGEFTTVGGFRSQILTHSINLERSRQEAEPIVIGPYCFVGTGCVILGGARLPARSVLGAMGLLNQEWTGEGMLYAGVPARPIKTLSESTAYFHRPRGYVD